MSDLITPYDGHAPQIAPGVFVDRSARLIGRITLEERVSIWPGAVLRADDDEIVIKAGSAVLDLALVEAPLGKPEGGGRRLDQPPGLPARGHGEQRGLGGYRGHRAGQGGGG